MGWIGVDLDGTLAQYDGWKGYDHIGEPIPAMVNRVKAWIAEGKDVRIFTARVGGGDDRFAAYYPIVRWCEQHLGKVLPVTAQKDMYMNQLWDDRVVQVETNTGRRMDGIPDGPTTP
jgi:hypothetical protein